MNARQLQDRLRSSSPPLLLHVLPEEIFTAQRIPGSQNACVYETAFLHNVARLAPLKDQDIVVYGAGTGSLDSQTAADVLIKEGYTRVEGFPGGLSEWKASGFPLEGDGKLPVMAPLDGAYEINVQESVVRWTGRNLFNHHNGTVGFASGEIVLKNGEIASADCLIDMNSIVCEDLTEAEWNVMLIQHLRSPDFFDVENHPTARLEFANAQPLLGASEGTPNYVIQCSLTIRGIPHPQQILAVVACADGNRITGQAQFEVDRTDFGSRYGSGRFFQFLGKHLVNDHIHLHVKLHADRLIS